MAYNGTLIPIKQAIHDLYRYRYDFPNLFNEMKGPVCIIFLPPFVYQCALLVMLVLAAFLRTYILFDIHGMLYWSLIGMLLSLVWLYGNEQKVVSPHYEQWISWEKMELSRDDIRNLSQMLFVISEQTVREAYETHRIYHLTMKKRTDGRKHEVALFERAFFLLYALVPLTMYVAVTGFLIVTMIGIGTWLTVQWLQTSQIVVLGQAIGFIFSLLLVLSVMLRASKGLRDSIRNFSFRFEPSELGPSITEILDQLTRRKKRKGPSPALNKDQVAKLRACHLACQANGTNFNRQEAAKKLGVCAKIIGDVIHYRGAYTREKFPDEVA